MNQLTFAILLLILALIIHLVEEIKTGFRKQLIIGEMPRSLFIGMNVLIYSYALVMLILSWLGNPASIWMAWIFTVGNLINASGHIAAMIYHRGYFPGGISAFVLLATSGYLISVLLSIPNSGSL